MQTILKDELLDLTLLEKGYVVIPFLNRERVEQLRDFYLKNHPLANEGMYASAHVSDIAFRMRMNDHIKTVFKESLENTFINCIPLGGSFLAKGKTAKGVLSPHQDWNIVDERKFRSFNIWVPLVDLNRENGTIQILPESHKWLKTYRSANISSAFESVNDLLWGKLIPLFMKKGEALIYDHRLLHASGENFTDELRLAAVFGIIPNDASMFYYHQKNEYTLEVFESNPEFFLMENIFDGPKGLKKVSEIPYSQNWNRRELEEIVNGNANLGNSINKGFWSNLKLFFRR